MFEQIGKLLNGEKDEKEKSPRQEDLEKDVEVRTLKKKADESEGEMKTSSEIERGEEGIVVKIKKEYIPSDAEERYLKAQEELDEMRDKNRSDAKELNDRYDSLIEERKDIIQEIVKSEDEEKEGLVSELGKKNKEIRKFEEEKLDI